MKYSIEITQDHIDRADKFRKPKKEEPSIFMSRTVVSSEPCKVEVGDPFNCPIQYAIDEQTPFSGYVYRKRMFLMSKKSWIKEFPVNYNRFTDFVDRWEAGKSVKSFRFDFEVPDDF